MCVTICGIFCPDEGAVVGYGNWIRVKYPAKWGVQIAEMIFQTRSRYNQLIIDPYCEISCISHQFTGYTLTWSTNINHVLTQMMILLIPVISSPDIRWLILRFFKFQSYAFPTFVDLYGNSSNSSHLLSRHSLTHMTILRIPVICFPDIRWLIWRFFEFQSYAFPTFVDLYGNSSNSSHLLIQFLFWFRQ